MSYEPNFWLDLILRREPFVLPSLCHARSLRALPLRRLLLAARAHEARENKGKGEADFHSHCRESYFWCAPNIVAPAMAEARTDCQDNICSVLCQKFPARIADQSKDRARLHRYVPALC